MNSVDLPLLAGTMSSNELVARRCRGPHHRRGWLRRGWHDSGSSRPELQGVERRPAGEPERAAGGDAHRQGLQGADPRSRRQAVAADRDEPPVTWSRGSLTFSAAWPTRASRRSKGPTLAVVSSSDRARHRSAACRRPLAILDLTGRLGAGVEALKATRASGGKVASSPGRDDKRVQRQARPDHRPEPAGPLRSASLARMPSASVPPATRFPSSARRAPVTRPRSGRWCDLVQVPPVRPGVGEGSGSSSSTSIRSRQPPGS